MTDAKPVEIPAPLQVALDQMRECGDPRADACMLGIEHVLRPADESATRFVNNLVFGVFRLSGFTPRRIGLPMAVVSRLRQERLGPSAFHTSTHAAGVRGYEVYFNSLVGPVEVFSSD